MAMSPPTTVKSSRSTRPRPFFARQFGLPRTGPQNAFDVVFGIVGPILCVLCDPLVFRGGVFGRPIYVALSVGAYCAIAIGLVALTTWLTVGRPAALLSGLLSAAAMCAVGVGLLLLPLSVIGLLALIGVLGFMPFVTAFVCWRNAVRAYESAAGDKRTPLIWSASLIIGLACPISLHYYIAWQTERGIQLVLSLDPQHQTEGVALLRPLRKLADLDSIVLSYGTSQDQDRRRRLSEAYYEITGADIERRWMIVDD